MSAQRPTVEVIFAAASDIADPSARAAYVLEACAADESLRLDVESLLDAHDRAGPFLEEFPSAAQAMTPDPMRGVAVSNRDEGNPLPAAATRVRHVGDYELLEQIGGGGMGVIYKARQLSLNRFVAVKMVLAGHLASNADVKRFRAEAQAAASLDHPNIIPIYEVGEHEGQHYFSMRLVDGQNLADKFESQELKFSNLKDAALLAAKVARAVHYAHEHGVLHRDLKPGNILLDAHNEPYVTDFGLARCLKTPSSLTLSGSVLGTPSFMAPEQAAGKLKHLTEAADIYSLGAVLYYLLTGRPPFAADSLLSTLVQVLESDVISPRALNPRISSELERVCLRCLEKRPELRYASAAALADDLDRFLQDEPVTVQSASLSWRLRNWARRHPALAFRLAVLALCTGISQVNYHLLHPVPPWLHAQILCALVLWAMLSALCQWALHRQFHVKLVRFIWAGADVGLVTAVLHINQGFHGPLIAFYAVVVAASGLWFRVPLVLFTTAMALLGYGLSALDTVARGGRIEHLHWHLIYGVALIVTGFLVAYQVHRVRALSRFYERRPLA